MATKTELRRIAGLVRKAGDEVERCAGVGEAIVSLGRPLVNEPVHVKRFFRTEVYVPPTHFTESQEKVIEVAKEARWELDYLIRERVTGDLVKAEARMEQIIGCCATCALENTKRIRDGKPFKCFAREGRGKGKDGFRFELNKDGDVVER